MSTVSNMTVISSEDSCSYPADDSELELGLGLSLGGGGRPEPPPTSWVPYSIISSAMDLTSSSSSPVTKIKVENECCGAKMVAPSFPPPAPSALRSQVAGWPPVANYRMNSFVNHAKLPAPRKSDLNVDKRTVVDAVVDQTNHVRERNNNNVKERGLLKSTFVKVNVDGISIGRKVDVNAYGCYATLTYTLDQMFDLSSAVGGRRWNVKEQLIVGGTGQSALSLDGSSEFVLTYEDKEGDWMLVGDVPWEMFVTSVRRLRIRKSSEVNGPGKGRKQTGRLQSKYSQKQGSAKIGGRHSGRDIFFGSEF